jgi:hypothetical protein
MMVKMGDADAFVSGLTYDYPDVIRPSLQIHHTARGAARAAGVYLMIVDDRVYLFTDATVNIDPTAEDLVEIACLAADFAKRLELDPRVAFLSFSNFGSTPHPLSDKVRRAVEMTKIPPPRPDRGWRNAGGYSHRCRNHREPISRSAKSGMPMCWSSHRSNRQTLPTNCSPVWAMPRRSDRSCSGWARRCMSCNR